MFAAAMPMVVNGPVEMLIVPFWQACGAVPSTY
jgi:hypothetical protein